MRENLYGLINKKNKKEKGIKRGKEGLTLGLDIYNMGNPKVVRLISYLCNTVICFISVSLGVLKVGNFIKTD